MKKTIYGILMMALMMNVSVVSAVDDTYPMCDMNGDGIANLTDVVLFSQIRSVMDLNDDGVSDLSDLVIFMTNRDTEDWCAETFASYFEEVEEELVDVKKSSGSGLSFDRVKKYLFGDFITYLKTIFVTHEDLALTQAKIQLGEDSSEVDCKVSSILADKFNKTYNYNGWISKPNSNQCVKIINR